MRNASAAAPNTIVAQQADEQYGALSPAAIAMTNAGSSSANAGQAAPAKLWIYVHNPSVVSRSVDLAATGLPEHWLLSFCYAKVCQPSHSTIALAAQSSMRVELQVVPLSGTTGPWSMHVGANGGSVVHIEIADGAKKSTATVSATSGS